MKLFVLYIQLFSLLAPAFKRIQEKKDTTHRSSREDMRKEVKDERRKKHYTHGRDSRKIHARNKAKIENKQRT